MNQLDGSLQMLQPSCTTEEKLAGLLLLSKVLQPSLPPSVFERVINEMDMGLVDQLLMSGGDDAQDYMQLAVHVLASFARACQGVLAMERFVDRLPALLCAYSALEDTEAKQEVVEMTRRMMLVSQRARRMVWQDACFPVLQPILLKMEGDAVDVLHLLDEASQGAHSPKRVMHTLTTIMSNTDTDDIHVTCRLCTLSVACSLLDSIDTLDDWTFTARWMDGLLDLLTHHKAPSVRSNVMRFIVLVSSHIGTHWIFHSQQRTLVQLVIQLASVEVKVGLIQLNTTTLRQTQDVMVPALELLHLLLLFLMSDSDQQDGIGLFDWQQVLHLQSTLSSVFHDACTYLLDLWTSHQSNQIPTSPLHMWLLRDTVQWMVGDDTLQYQAHQLLPLFLRLLQDTDNMDMYRILAPAILHYMQLNVDYTDAFVQEKGHVTFLHFLQTHIDTLDYGDLEDVRDALDYTHIPLDPALEAKLTLAEQKR